MKIRAAVSWEKEQPFRIEDVDLEEPRADEVVVRIVSSGVCHSDLIVRDQWYPVPQPVILGHEGAGVVEAVGAGVTTVAAGDHVVLSFLGCGVCRACLRGWPGYCRQWYLHNMSGGRPDQSSAYHQDGTRINGHFFCQSSFATHALAHERSVVKVPVDVPLELLGPLGCGIQTGAGAVLNALHPPAGSSIAVFGAGSVGMSAVMAAHAVGCTTIIAVDINDKRLDAATGFGATHTINPLSADPVAEIQGITDGGVDFSLETTANPNVMRQAVLALDLLGVCGQIGAAAIGTDAAIDMNSIMFGRTIRGIIEGDAVPQVFIPKMIEMYKQGRLPFDRLVSEYGFDDINLAAEESLKGDVFKPVLRFG